MPHLQRGQGTPLRHKQRLCLLLQVHSSCGAGDAALSGDRLPMQRAATHSPVRRRDVNETENETVTAFKASAMRLELLFQLSYIRTYSTSYIHTYIAYILHTYTHIHIHAYMDTLHALHTYVCSAIESNVV